MYAGQGRHLLQESVGDAGLCGVSLEGLRLEGLVVETQHRRDVKHLHSLALHMWQDKLAAKVRAHAGEARTLSPMLTSDSSVVLRMLIMSAGSKQA